MATYGSGFATNSKDLWDKVDGYIGLTTGWSTFDNISTEPMRDKVYVSNGSSSTERIYFRMRTGITDPHRNGQTLKRSSIGDGYSSSVAFNIYQLWNAATRDGYGELGTIGPRVITLRANNAQVWAADWQNSDVSSWYWDQWANMSFSISTERTDAGGSIGVSAFDGSKFIYIPSTDLGGTDRYDIVEQTNTILANPSSAFGGSKSTDATVYAVDPSSNLAYLYGFSANGTPGNRFCRYGIATNTWSARADPTWGSDTRAGKSAWDGYNTIHALRGSDTNQYSYYNITTNVWTVGPIVPFNTFRGNNLVYVPGTPTRPNRLYADRGEGSGAFASLDLAADGTPSGSWTSRAGNPQGFGTNEVGSRLFYFGGDFLWGLHTASATSREVTKYKISTDTWVNQAGTAGQVYDYLAADTSSTGYMVSVQNHQTYVPVLEATTLQFWYFGDADRIIVITRDSSGVYDYVYLGAIDSYYTRQFATLSAPLTPGTEKQITVSNGSLFTAGQTVSLYDRTGTSGFDTKTGLDGYVRKFMNSERVELKSVQGNLLTIMRVTKNHQTGTRIGFDLAPYGITGFRNNIIQMNDHIPQNNITTNLLSNITAGLVPQLYRYSCPVPSEITIQSASETRTGQYVLWPFAIFDNSQYSGDEVRGQLKGVYVVDNSGTAVAGDIITFQGNNYLLFSFPSTAYSESRLFAIGPLT